MIDKVVNSNSSSTGVSSTDHQSNFLPTNILSPPSNSSSIQSSAVQPAPSGSSMTKGILQIDPSVKEKVNTTVDYFELSQEFIFNDDQIKQIEPVLIDDPEFQLSPELVFTTLNEIDVTTRTFEPKTSTEIRTPLIDLEYAADVARTSTSKTIILLFDSTILHFQGPTQSKKRVLEPIDAVRDVMTTLLNQHQQNNPPSIQTKPTRASRINNTTGVNITEDEFLKMLEEKDKKTSKKRRKQLNDISNQPNQISPVAIQFRDVDDREKEDSLEYEYFVRNQLDFVIEQTERVFSTDDPTLL